MNIALLGVELFSLGLFMAFLLPPLLAELKLSPAKAPALEKGESGAGIYCSKCGRLEEQAGANFCPACGKELRPGK